MSTMTETYPQLGQAFDEELKSSLHEIGFTGWVHLREAQRDGKVRLTWTYPIEGYKEWFKVLLVLEDGRLFIDLLRNPLGQKFGRTDIEGLIAYINKFIIKVN